MTNNFDKLIRDLKDAEYKQRPQGQVAYATKTAFQAKEELIAAGKEAVPAVIGCLKGHGPAHQRALAAQILGEIGDSRAVPTLIEMLRDTKMVVRGFSAEALGKIGDRQAIPALRSLTNQSGEAEMVRGFAMAALESMGMSVAAADEERAKKPERGTFQKIIFWVGLVLLFLGCLMTSSTLIDPRTVEGAEIFVYICEIPLFLLGGLLMYLGLRPAKPKQTDKEKET